MISATLNWSSLDRDGISAVAWAYYYFSIQFRENLEVAYRLYPGDMLKALVEGECDTDNLSPWPGVVEAGEKVNHDEFMRRLLTLSPIEPSGTAAHRSGWGRLSVADTGRG